MATTHELVSKALDRMATHATTKANDPRHASRKNTLSDLGRKLGDARTEWDKLKEPSALAKEDDKTDYDKYAKILAKGLPQLENGIIDAVAAFEGGDQFAEAESILNICSTLVSTFGALAGPEGAAVGKVLGALLGMVSTILGLFEPKKPSLLEQIELLLQQQQAKAEIGELKVALGDFQAFEDVWRGGYWKAVNLQNGPEVQRMREACVWLKSKDNQKEELRNLWFELLDTQCMTFLEVVKALPLALHALHKQDLSSYHKRNEAGLLTIGFETTQRMQEEFLKALVPVLQDRGMFWYLGTNGAMYATDYCTDNHGTPNPGFRKLGGGAQTRMSVAIAKADKGKANPNVHLFSLGPGRVFHANMTWPSGGLNYKDLPIEEVANCSDIWATYGPNHPDDGQKIYFYSAHGGKEIRGYALGDNNAKGETRMVWREPVDKVTWVRVVHFPRSVAGDPDENPENPRVLSNISWIVYGGCKSTSHVWVWSSDGKKGFVLAQDPERWGGQSYEVIAVDQRYLWISANMGYGAFATTHTSVIRALGKAAQPSRPSWFIARESTELSPCDDGTLFRTIRTRVTYKPYTIVDNDGEWSVALRDNWTDLPDEALQVQKLPNYDWHLVGGLLNALKHRAKPEFEAV